MYAIISMHTPDYQPLADYTWTQNKLEYAKYHGYEAYCKTDDFVLPKHQIGGEKLRLFREYFDAHPDVEWIWWLETDTLITNYTIKVEDFIDSNYHFIIGTDGNGMNAGSFFLRNSPEGNAYLNWLIKMWPKYETHHFYEQQAMIDSYEMPEWRSIIKVEPQHKFNAHDCWPNSWEVGFGVDKLGERAWWEPGDAVVHWPGSSLEIRLGRQIPYYMPKVIKGKTMSNFGQNEEVKIDWAHAGLVEGLVLSSKPKKILELGIGGGRSLESILTGLEYNNQPYHYTLVDNWGDWAGIMPPEVTELYGKKVHNIITSNEEDFVFSCKDKFDFIMSDADHNRADQWFEYVYDNLLNENGILIYHDVNMDDNWPHGNFFNLRNIYQAVKSKKISHRLFNVSSLPEEQCERGLLVIFKDK